MKNMAFAMLATVFFGPVVACISSGGGEDDDPETCPTEVNYPPGGVGKFYSEGAILEACRVDIASTMKIPEHCDLVEAKNVRVVCEGTDEVGIPLDHPIITTCREVLESTRGGKVSSLHDLLIIDTGECTIQNFRPTQKQEKSDLPE